MKKIIIIWCVFFSTLVIAEENKGITEAQLNKLIKSAEQMRNLSFKSAITTKVVTRQEIQSYIKEQLYREYSKEDIRNEEAFLKVFKLVTKDFGLEKFLLDFMTEQAAGIYDDANKKLYIADWIPAELQEPALFHELIHALDDQYFDLRTYLKKATLNDQKLARAAVVEGVGTYFMLKYLLSALQIDSEALDLDMLANFTDIASLPGMENAANAPKYLQGQLLFPYLKGMSLINKYIKKNSIDSLSTLYEKPPLSTEQVIHFEKYPTDKPVLMKINVKTGTGELAKWKKLTENNIGEYSLFLILKEKVPGEESETATEGWGNDVFVLLQNGDKYAIVFKTVWDTSMDAREFYDTFNKWCGGQHETKENTTWSKNADSGCLNSVQNSTVKLVVGAVDRKTAELLLAE